MNNGKKYEVDLTVRCIASISIEDLKKSGKLVIIKNNKKEFELFSRVTGEMLTQFIEGLNVTTEMRESINIEFLYKFLVYLKGDATRKNQSPKFFSKKINISFNPEEKTLLDNLSKQADTPDYLVKYLEQFKENVNVNQ